MNYLLKSYLPILIILGILFIPLPWNIFPMHGEFTKFFFDSIVQEIGKLFNLNLVLLDFSSDSKGLYILFGILSIISLPLSIFVLKKIPEKTRNVSIRYINTIITYYLTVILLKYGFDKLFKAQFNLPEPNILYTQFGKLDKDILFWSVMGSSHTYSIFMGLAELIPAFLLFHYKTRRIALFLSLGVIINIFAVNLCFDISVKLFSSFLLLINFFLLIPSLGTIWDVLILQKNIIGKIQIEPTFQYKRKPFLKLGLIILLLAESLLPYMKSFNFQDDHALRPFLHGAYEVELIIENTDTLKAEEMTLKKLFIHRDGYIIFQDKNDNLVDYHLEIDQLKNLALLTDYESNKYMMRYKLSKKDSIVSFTYSQNNLERVIQTKMIDWRKLPALQSQFHWSVD